LKFFMTAVIETANKSKDTFMAIMDLRHRVEHQILSLGARAERAKNLLLYLYQRPIVSANEAAEVLQTTPQTARSLITQLEDLGILKEITGYGRNRAYAFDQYITIFMR